MCGERGVRVKVGVVCEGEGVWQEGWMCSPEHPCPRSGYMR